MQTITERRVNRPHRLPAAQAGEHPADLSPKTRPAVMDRGVAAPALVNLWDCATGSLMTLSKADALI